MPTGQEPKASVSTTFSSPWPLVFFPSSFGSLKQCLMPIPWVSFLAFFLFRLYHVLLSCSITQGLAAFGHGYFIQVSVNCPALCLNVWVARILPYKFWVWLLSIGNCFRSSGNTKLSTSGSGAFSSLSVFQRA